MPAPRRSAQQRRQQPAAPATQAPPLELPTIKRPPVSGTGKVLLYGGPKVGKSTTAHEMYPEALILDTEGSTVALEAFIIQVRGWAQFRQVGTLLAANPGQYPAVIVDTVDVLARMCADHAVSALAGSAAQSETGKVYVHASDFGYGKGWEAIRTEFELRIAKLCQIVPNVIFVSHAKEVKIESRAGDYTAYTPDVAPSSVRKFMEGFVDHIIFAQLQGSERLLRTQPTDAYQAGGRVSKGIDPLPDPMPLDGGTLRGALEALRGTLGASDGSGQGIGQVADSGAQTELEGATA